MFCMIVQYAALFHFLLAIDAAGVPCAFALLISTIVTLTGFAIEELAELREYSDHAERWAKDWKAMLLEITSSLLRKLCVQCNVCHRRPGDDRSTFFGWHLDHLLKFWKKDRAVSDMKTVRAMIKEALKTCLGECNGSSYATFCSLLISPCTQPVPIATSTANQTQTTRSALDTSPGCSTPLENSTGRCERSSPSKR